MSWADRCNSEVVLKANGVKISRKGDVNKKSRTTTTEGEENETSPHLVIINSEVATKKWADSLYRSA